MRILGLHQTQAPDLPPEGEEDWFVRMGPRRVLVTVCAILFTCCAFTAATGAIWSRHTDMEQVSTPIFCGAFLLVLLASILVPDHRLQRVATMAKAVGGAMLLAGVVDGLVFTDPAAPTSDSHVTFYVCWLPVYYAATFYVSRRHNAYRWSLLFLAIFTLFVVTFSIIGPLPMHHDNVVLLYFSIFPQLAGILIIHFISVFREDLASERTRTQLLQDNAAALQRESEAAERARQQAEASDRAKSIFLANMSHELRTPLNAILGFSQMMEGGMLGPLSTAYKGYAGDIRGSAENLLSQINDILEVSRIELGASTMREETVDLPDLIDSCTSLVRQRAEEKGISITVDAPRTLSPVNVDPAKMKQVITNIIGNAVKFNKPGGTVTIAVLEGGDGTMLIRIADTGIGMSTEEVEHALDVFHQSDNGFIRRYEGVGIGLSIARSLVELHDGTIHIDSSPGAGTVVSIELPRTRRIARSAPPQVTMPLARTG